MSDTTTASPLAEVNEFSLDELWDRIDRKLVAGLPQDIMDPDIDAITARLRSQRDKFTQDQIAAANAPKRTRSTGAAKAVPIVKDITF